MPLLQISAREAIERLKTDSFRAKWPDHRFPAERREGLVEVFCSPSFEIRRDDKIFTIGSCFARNIEERLSEIGLDTVLYGSNISQRLVELGEALAVTNKYSAPAMRSELEWACGIGRPPEDQVLLPLAGGKVLDVFLNPRRKTGVPIKQARSLRAFTNGLFERITECRVIVMTLGLVEVWRDLQSGLRINVAPLAAIDLEPERFVLEVLSYDEIFAELEAIHALLSANCPRDFKMLVTVSPVPLHATFRPEDVMTANAYSKAVQRAALEAFVLRHENVDYFPSFETVTLTDRRVAFDRDNRHVQRGVVARVVDRFVTAYIPELSFATTTAGLAASASRPVSEKDLLRAAKLHERQGLFSRAASHYRQCIERHGESLDLISMAELRFKYGACLISSGDIEGGLRQSEMAAFAPDVTAKIVNKCVDRFLVQGRLAAARRLLDETVDNHGRPVGLMIKVAQLAAMAGDDHDAREALATLLKRPDLDPSDLETVQTLLNQVDAPERADA